MAIHKPSDSAEGARGSQKPLTTLALSTLAALGLGAATYNAMTQPVKPLQNLSQKAETKKPTGPNEQLELAHSTDPRFLGYNIRMGNDKYIHLDVHVDKQLDGQPLTLVLVDEEQRKKAKLEEAAGKVCPDNGQRAVTRTVVLENGDGVASWSFDKGHKTRFKDIRLLVGGVQGKETKEIAVFNDWNWNTTE